MDRAPRSIKTARADHPIAPVLAERYSPYAFDPRPLPAADLRSLLEAARWAPSSFNEQPWRYLVAVRQDEEEFARLLDCLVEGNRTWARQASVLMVAVASLTLARDGRPNTKALHDVGLAAANLTVEATLRGLVVHQMGGILPDQVRRRYGVPEDFQPVTALAVGYPGDGSALPEALRARDEAPRTRRPQAEFVFAGRWGRAAVLD